jgi:hypothetical protein
MHACVHAYIYISSTCIYTHIYIHTYIHVHTHIHTHTHTHTHTQAQAASKDNKAGKAGDKKQSLYYKAAGQQARDAYLVPKVCNI